MYLYLHPPKTTVWVRKKEKYREISSVGSEHLPYKQGVGGSNPSSPTAESLTKFVRLFSFYIVYPDHMYFTYILYSKSTDSFYKGSTQNVQERLKRHNRKLEKATQVGAPWILLWSISKPTKGEAQILEYKLKNLSRKRTCEFILKYNEGVGGPDELLFVKQLSGC